VFDSWCRHHIPGVLEYILAPETSNTKNGSNPARIGPFSVDRPCALKQNMRLPEFGGVPEWSKGSDCKSDASASEVQILPPPPNTCCVCCYARRQMVGVLLVKRGFLIVRGLRCAKSASTLRFSGGPGRKAGCLM
jgi:hypothetical protein